MKNVGLFTSRGQINHLKPKKHSKIIYLSLFMQVQH